MPACIGKVKQVANGPPGHRGMMGGFQPEKPPPPKRRRVKVLRERRQNTSSTRSGESTVGLVR